MINEPVVRKRSALISIVLFAAAVVVSAQNINIQTPQSNEILHAQYWRTAADDITADLKKDAVQLSNWQRAVLYIRLSEVWQQYNQESADLWFRESLEAISRNINMEDFASIKSQMVTARKLLTICSQIK
ncbi:MAG: hypothetical protein KIT57_00395 [Blastocatellales bacterium]|nr:hypothetical protein [Blastocatellales bacterium]